MKCMSECQCGRHKPKTARFYEAMVEVNRRPSHVAATAAWHRGRKRTPETCAKIAAKAKGRVSAMRGRRHSPETRAKMSAARKGVKRLTPMPPEQRAKHSAAMMGKLKGRKQSPEHIAKKAAAKRGKPNNVPLGLCDICGQEKGLYKDHCHASGHRRGMLCIRCNTGIGQLQDSPEILEKAAAYIRAHRLKLAL